MSKNDYPDYHDWFFLTLMVGDGFIMVNSGGWQLTSRICEWEHNLVHKKPVTEAKGFPSVFPSTYPVRFSSVFTCGAPKLGSRMANMTKS